MPKKTVKRCIRPQCMEIYEETEKNRFCMCGAQLQIIEIEIKPKKNPYKKPVNTSKPKSNSVPKTEEKRASLSEEDEVVEKGKNTNSNNATEIIEERNKLIETDGNEDNEATNEDVFDFFDIDEEEQTEEDSEDNISGKKAFLYLLLEDADVEFELSSITRIGRETDGVQVDIDLSAYAGKDVSRKHAVIRKEQNGYYITNVSRNHSVRVLDQDDNEVALEYGKKALLKNGDGIILSKKILLQFEEEE